MADNKKSSISKRSSCYLLNLKQPEATARRLKLSFQRTAAVVSMAKAGRTVEASIGFLDISETGAGIFTPELLHKGSVVEVCITEPAVLKVRGVVAWSVPVTSGIHGGKFKCRSGIQFVFEGEIQQKALTDFLRKAALDPIENIKSHQPPAAHFMPPGNNTDATLMPPGTPPAALEAAALSAPPAADATPAPAAAPAPALAEAPAPAPEAAAEGTPPAGEGTGTPQAA